MSDLSFLSIPELGALLRSRRLSATELTRHSLDRLERLGPSYNAVVTVLREPAVAEAAQRDRELAAGRIRGPLHGIPYGVKDLLAVDGAPTTWGAQPFRDRMLRGDATAVRRLRQAGAVLCAKLAMVSAVAAGLVPFAIGSETWGSIQSPAAFCGLSGLRPTYGRVSRHGAMALSWSLDKLGPLARTAEDCGLILAAIAGPDPLDPTTLARRFNPPRRTPARRRFRLGILRGTRNETQPEVVQNFDASLAVLGEFADLTEDLELPDFPYDAAAGIILGAEAASAFEPLLESGRITELTAPEDRLGGYPGEVILAKDYLRALRIRRPASLALDRLLAEVDAVVAPSRPTVAWPLDTQFDRVSHRGGIRIGGAANLCGVPGLFVMNGLGEAGLPTSLQLTGRALSEGVLLDIGMRYQERTGFHRLRPPGL